MDKPQDNTVGLQNEANVTVQEDISPTHHVATYDMEPPRDSYIYSSRWGAYKGSVQGKLGGMFSYGGLGLLAGLAVGAAAIVGVVAFAPALVGTVGLLSIFGGLAAVTTTAGMLYGYHDFAETGRVSGAVGAALDEYERRHDKVMEVKFRSLSRTMAKVFGKEQELAELAPEMYEAVTLDKTPNAPAGAGPNMAAATAPTTKLFHWKTAVIGIGIGLLVGGIVAATAGLAIPALTAIPTAHALFAYMGIHAIEHVGFGAAAAIMTTTAAAGATFGVDRSLLRKTFDFTDGLFSGDFIHHAHKAKAREPQLIAKPVAKAPVITSKPVKIAKPVDALIDTEALQKAADQEQKVLFTDRVKRSPGLAGVESKAPKKDSDEAYYRTLVQAQKALAELDPGTSIKH